MNLGDGCIKPGPAEPEAALAGTAQRQDYFPAWNNVGKLPADVAASISFFSDCYIGRY